MTNKPDDDAPLTPAQQLDLDRRLASFDEDADHAVDWVDVARELDEKRADFRQSALRAWNEYQATGLHVSAREADAWLMRLEADEKHATPPTAHG